MKHQQSTIAFWLERTEIPLGICLYINPAVVLFAAKSTLLQKSHIHSLWPQGKPYQSEPKKKPHRNRTHPETTWNVWMCLIRDSERVHSLLWKKERSGSQNENVPSWSKRGCAAPEVLLMVSTGSCGFFYYLLKP